MSWLGKLDQALKYLSLALEKSPDPEIAAHLGEVLWVTGKKKQAKNAASKKVEQKGKKVLDDLKKKIKF